ncbi:RNI-like superfamily protein [Rhynchospora pubera]|uniref:RNI-like superfamily protein n=1 Tax=Rhynchospora pubera TaxID=906938 RepID=A0AAV8HK67_9POAL|nr:RNI-like superfamily protein [Rhynchospora pubera]
MGKSKRGEHKTKFEKMPLSRFLLDWEKLDTNACVPLSCHKVVITKTKWMELPSDILLMIFQKMGAISILTKAILLCRDWLELARNEPLIWRKVDMTCHGKKFGSRYLQDIACIAVNWSAGQLEEFSAEGFVSDDLLQYLADSTSNLKSFSLINCRKISQEALEKTIKRWPLLEEIELTRYWMCPPEFYQTIGLSCPQLKCFRLNTIYIEFPEYDDIDKKDSIAKCIGKTMHNLCSLQLIGSRLTMEGDAGIQVSDRLSSTYSGKAG